VDTAQLSRLYAWIDYVRTGTNEKLARTAARTYSSIATEIDEFLDDRTSTSKVESPPTNTGSGISAIVPTSPAQTLSAHQSVNYTLVHFPPEIRVEILACPLLVERIAALQPETTNDRTSTLGMRSQHNNPIVSVPSPESSLGCECSEVPSTNPFDTSTKLLPSEDDSMVDEARTLLRLVNILSNCHLPQFDIRKGQQQQRGGYDDQSEASVMSVQDLFGQFSRGKSTRDLTEETNVSTPNTGWWRGFVLFGGVFAVLCGCLFFARVSRNRKMRSQRSDRIADRFIAVSSHRPRQNNNSVYDSTQTTDQLRQGHFTLYPETNLGSFARHQTLQHLDIYDQQRRQQAGFNFHTSTPSGVSTLWNQQQSQERSLRREENTQPIFHLRDDLLL